MEKMKGLQGKVCDLMADFANGKEEVDMQRMTTIIKNQTLNVLNQVSIRDLQCTLGNLNSIGIWIRDQ